MLSAGSIATAARPLPEESCCGLSSRVRWKLGTGQVEFETNFGWVPILHFSLSMIAVYGSLSKADDAAERYAFTEADEFLSFQRDQSAVHIEPSFRPVRVISPMATMRIAVKSFTEQVISDLGSAYPSLLDNPLAEE
jgi:hypothetical protein